METRTYVEVETMMEKLLGEQWMADKDGDYYIPVGVLHYAISASPQLIVHEPAENENAHF